MHAPQVGPRPYNIELPHLKFHQGKFSLGITSSSYQGFFFLGSLNL